MVVLATLLWIQKPCSGGRNFLQKGVKFVKSIPKMEEVASSTEKLAVSKPGLADPAREARRRRIEIRRLKVIAHAGTCSEILGKRSRSEGSIHSDGIVDPFGVFHGDANTVHLSGTPEGGSAADAMLPLESFPEKDEGFGGEIDGLAGFGRRSMPPSVAGDGGVLPWGYASICGRRKEMEDAVAAVPRYLCVPSETVGESQNSGESSTLHFFGVYDGHGGAQVANFCKNTLHKALIEELEVVMNDERFSGGEAGVRSHCQEQWGKALVSCFNKVDSEVSGEVFKRKGYGEQDTQECCLHPVAPETVGSTAVVAIVGSCQIIVANCGDSRAVLSRGGKAIALSFDHKPEREDELERIEAAGGRVIQWNGYRVFGMLAMSRAIGDRYLKPYVISDPEVTFTERRDNDECLILASDGLWDVLSNEEVCEVARRCLARRRNRNASSSPKSRDEEMDPSVQAVADHLSMLAIQRGSSDNISVLVVDLLARKNA